MHGPYTASLQLGRGEPLLLSEEELREAQPAAERFYADASPALAEGALRCAHMAAAALLEPGESCEIEISGYEGSGKQERPQAWKRGRARRDEHGRFLSTLGSRWSERHFRHV